MFLAGRSRHNLTIGLGFHGDDSNKLIWSRMCSCDATKWPLARGVYRLCNLVQQVTKPISTVVVSWWIRTGTSSIVLPFHWGKQTSAWRLSLGYDCEASELKWKLILCNCSLLRSRFLGFHAKLPQRNGCSQPNHIPFPLWLWVFCGLLNRPITNQ